MTNDVDISEFSGILTSLEIFAQKGNVDQVKRLTNELYRKFGSRLKEINGMEEGLAEDEKLIQSLKDKVRKLQSTIEASKENYESSLITFEKFRTGIRIVQCLKSFQELPKILEDIRELLSLSAIGLVLSAEEYQEYVPEDIPVEPREEIGTRFTALGTRGDGLSRPFIGLVQADEDLSFFFPNQTIEKQGSCFIFPLFDKYERGKAIGTLAFHDLDAKRYTPAKATDFLEHFCDSVGCSIVTMREHEKLERENVIDPLTGVHNRAYLLRHAPRILDFADRKGFSVSMLFVDLDGFKKINDTMGHDVGDRILVEAARCLKTMIRQYDILVRLGGDEFVVLLPDASENNVKVFKERLNKELESVCEAPGCVLPEGMHLRASVGFAMYHAGQSLDDLLREADQSMYQDKNGTSKVMG